MHPLVSLMPTKKPARPKPGRPKTTGRITTRFSMVATPGYLEWLSGFAVHAGKPEVSDLAREALSKLAKDLGFKPPPMR